MPFLLVIGASIIVQSLPFFLLLVPSVLTNCCKRKKVSFRDRVGTQFCPDKMPFAHRVKNAVPQTYIS